MPKKRGIVYLCALLTTCLSLLAVLLDPVGHACTNYDCPRCYKNAPPLGGSGTHTDGRRILKVFIDGTWDESPGDTEDRIYNGTQGAISEWNAAEDTSCTPSAKTAYYFQLNQGGGVTAADVVITRVVTAPPLCASTAIKAGGTTFRPKPDTIKLRDKINDNLTDAQAQIVITHEFGHVVGLIEDANCDTGNDIMRAGWDDYDCTFSGTFTVQAKNVGQSNKQLASNRASTCTHDAPLVTNFPQSQAECASAGKYWNLSSESCHDEPQTEAQCTTAGQYWNFSQGTCSPTPPNYCGSGHWCTPTFWQLYSCNGTWDCSSCECLYGSPIVVDVQGDGFDLTNASNGVDFNLTGRRLDRWGWTSQGSDDAFLFLDRNGNGVVDDGRELFGNFTQQPKPPVGEYKNGFLALAVFDKRSNGGNADGKITFRDQVFVSLRLWQDWNHNGLSEPDELRSLAELGIAKIDLDYQESDREDQHGNKFRYRSRVRDTNDAQVGRWAWDVFFVRLPRN